MPRQRSWNTNYRVFKYKMRMWFRGASIVLVAAIFTIYNIWSENSIQIPVLESRSLHESGCTPPANPKILALPMACGVLYCFVGLAIIADEFFVPALDEISEAWGLSPDVAGATLMAAGGSSPELFTAGVGTFLRSDVGFGAIIGSAVFNISFVVGVCAIFCKEPMQLTWWPVIRDSSYYIIVIAELAIFIGVSGPNKIVWWEALLLHLTYWLYVLLIRYNNELYAYIMYLLGSSDKIYPAGAGDEENSMSLPFNTASKFRASIMTLMTHDVDFVSMGHLNDSTAKITDKVEMIFKKFDTDNSGYIDHDELKSVLEHLECSVDEVSFKEVLGTLDKNNDGKIDFEEFSVWFIASDHRLKAEIGAFFAQCDSNGDGKITQKEFGALLIALGNDDLTSEVIETKIKEVKADWTDGLTLPEFSDWYSKTDLWKEYKHRAEVMQDVAEGLSIYPPTEGGVATLAWYIITLPMVAMFVVTVVDVRKPGNRKYKWQTFGACLCWMGGFSYCMVWWTEIVGSTAGIPSVIMGLTFLAAGTSVPDMLSALIVAQQGEGGQAVSSCIGSNVFDICVGLAFPWLLFIAVYQEDVHIAAGNLTISVVIILGCVVILVGLFKLKNWQVTPISGYLLILVYLGFVAQQLALTDWNNC